MRPTCGSRLVVAAAAMTLLFLASPHALAVSQCGDQKDSCQCGKSNPYPCCSNGGNCTWWAWEAACCNWKVGLPGWGNANQWAGNAKANPSYEVKTSPVAGSIGVRVSGSYGHVVWVTSVSGSTIKVTEMNCWGNYGMRTATYSASYFDGGFIVQKKQCACQPQQTSTKPCGTKCGIQTRTCGSDCQWGAYGSCSGEGVCAANTTESQTCAGTGKQSRTCSAACSWSAWSACVLPDGGPGKDARGADTRHDSGPGPVPASDAGSWTAGGEAGANAYWTQPSLEGGCQVGPGRPDPLVVLLLALLGLLARRAALAFGPKRASRR